MQQLPGSRSWGLIKERGCENVMTFLWDKLILFLFPFGWKIISLYYFLPLHVVNVSFGFVCWFSVHNWCCRLATQLCAAYLLLPARANVSTDQSSMMPHPGAISHWSGVFHSWLFDLWDNKWNAASVWCHAPIPMKKAHNVRLCLLFIDIGL